MHVTINDDLVTPNRSKKEELTCQIKDLTEQIKKLDLRYDKVIHGDAPKFSENPLTQELSLGWWLDGRPISEVWEFAEFLDAAPNDEYRRWTAWMISTYDGEGFFDQGF